MQSFILAAAMIPVEHWNLPALISRIARRCALFEQTYETAVGAGQLQAASEILTAATLRWGASHAFSFSPLAECGTASMGGSDALLNELKGAKDDNRP